MSTAGSVSSILRSRRDGEHHAVSFVELFFDLVFVFAITQLSHALLGDFTIRGSINAALLLMAVWWVWVFTLWATNWLHPTRLPVRLLLYALMLAGLVMSTAIPHAFTTRGLVFAIAYVVMQVGRGLFMLWVLRGHDDGNYRNFLRITIWLAASGLLWLAGGLADDEARFALWIAALAVEYIAPSAGFWTPGLGRSTTADWNVEGAHMAERCGLFIIIALGESILVTGATFAEHDWTAATAGAFLSAFVGSVAMWWIYFNIGAERGSRHIATSDDPGRLARIAYTYLHILLVAGIVVAAVADEFVLAHPVGHTDPDVAVAILGGPALFLAGNMLFKRCSARYLPLSHVVGLALLAAIVAAVPIMPPLAIAALVTAVLVVVAIWETVSLGHAAE